ncbi:hypothetical protein, conserved [Eimeria praecox]|uniref:Uncharacterized protein n=1 Tax=Eimeria praecox TaxID=51316 RepID=U6H6C1_9EIME|nr:hypothetical protein, conserved [Eimeria praecox]
MAAAGVKQGGVVGMVTSGLPARSVFGGAPPLDEALGSLADAPLSHNVIHVIDVRRSSIGVLDGKPTDRRPQLSYRSFGGREDDPEQVMGGVRVGARAPTTSRSTAVRGFWPIMTSNGLSSVEE